MDTEKGSKKQKSPEKERTKSTEKERSTKKIVEEEAVTQEEKEEVVKEPAAKRKKSIPRKTTRKRQKLEEDPEKDELKGFLDIVPREEAPIEIESLSTKFPIVDWKTCVLTETFMYYQVFRGDGSSKNYKVLSEMLEDFDRMDVEELFRLVKERYSTSAPEGFDLMLWGDLHTLFEHDEDDEIWRDQHEYNLLSWRLCDFCGIHILLMDNGLAIHMLTEKKYPLSQEMLSKMLSRKLEVDHESSQAFELLRFIRAQKGINTDESLAKHKALELEIEHLLRTIVNQDILSIVQSNSVIDTSNLQTELDCTKERFENSYNDMQQKIERLQAQLGDQKGKSKDTLCISNTLDPLSQKLENKNVELKFQVRNYEKENAHLKTTYKNLFDSIPVTHAQTKTIINSLQNKLHDTMYENAKLRAQLFDKVSEQKDTTKGVDNTAKTRSPQPRSNTKNDRVLYASKSSCSKNKEVEVIQICLWCVDSGCSKHMTRNLKLLINFVWKFLGTVRFANDHVAAILGFNLEIAFRRNTCFVKNLEGVDLLKGNRTTNLYTISLHEMASASPICLMARATPTKSWLWHQRLSHLNFDTINDLAKNDLVTGLLKFKYHKEHLCPSYKQGKSKRASHPPKPVPNSKQRLHLLHMDLCGPMRIARINGKRALYYPKNDHEDIRKLGAKGEKNLLFEVMYDDYIGGQPSASPRTVLAAQAPQVLQTPTATMTTSDTTPTPRSPSSKATSIPSTSQNLDELKTQQQQQQYVQN
ncbi:retrovirus-related pol polyprotein from transposon TNT 1-94 [Tanacetum coccineum]|uniref:Retrovirus-related pol polyprotein from transposon TNT 1-94 n=1 Tax=Tanacetum coccineum TaxID=301880 RepID=A0ABQ5ENL5_9ASTR